MNHISFKPFFLVLFLACSFLNSSQAQVKTPQPSPLGKLTQAVGLMEVNLEYSRPSKKGRQIFGDLVPFDEVWRTGANASTKVEFTDDVMINGQKLPKGKYALYTIPGKSQWTVIFHKNLEYWGTGGKDYKPEEDALRTTVPAGKLSEPVESFTIEVSDITNNGASIALMWDQVLVKVPFTTDTEGRVMASIDKIMAGPGAGDYYQAARFYQETGKDARKALDWINKAISLSGEKYWYLRLKSLLQADNGDYKGAIETAKRSKELAEKDDDDGYVKMNEKSIQEWSRK